MKKLTALILALVMLVPMIASCEKPQATATAEVTETAKTATADTSATIYVAVDGDDSADGTKDRPMATVNAAVAKALTLPAGTDAVVSVGAGEYFMTDTVVIPANELGSLTVIGDGEAVLTGGMAIPTDDFTPADDELSQRFPESAREYIVSVDLKKYGIDLDAVLSPYPEYRMITLNGEVLRPSRYPDFGYLHIKNGIDETVAKQDEDIEVNKSIIRETQKWQTTDGVRIFMYVRELYFAHRFDLKGVDAEKNTIRISSCDNEGYKSLDEFYFFNVPEEMTMAGEYYLSDDGILYIYKTEDFDGGEVRVTTMNGDMIKLDGAENFTLDGIVLQDCNATAVSGSANYLTVTNCTVRDVKNAIVTSSGHDIKIHANTLYNIFSNGVDLENDMLGLDPMNNEITYNELYNFAINESMELVGFCTYGANNLIAHNEAHDANWQVFYMHGFNNVIEYNEAYNLLYYNDDTGVYHFGGPGYFYGNVIRYNYFHNIGSGGTQYTVNGIYFDDGLMNQTAYGNVLVDIYGRGFLIGGGREHHVTGNLIINARNGILYDQRIYDAIWGEFWYREMDIRSVAANVAANEPWTTERFLDMFPWMRKVQLDGEKADPDDPYWFGAPAFSELKDNVMVISDPSLIKLYNSENDPAWRWTVKDAVRRFSEIENPTYIISTEDHSSLEAIAKLDLPDFIDIPFDKIGRNPKVPD